MAGRNLKVQQGLFHERETARILFGDGVGGMEEDRFEGSKEENQVFMSIFGLSDDKSPQADIGRHLKESMTSNYEISAPTCYSSIIDSSAEGFQHTKICSKETGIFERIAESASSWFGANAHNVNAKRKKMSSIEHLKCKNKEPRYSSSYTADDSVRLDRSKFSLSESMQYPLDVSQLVPCCIVESFRMGIVSSYYLYNTQGGINGTGNVNDNAGLHSKCTNQHIGDGKVVMGDNSITFPASQENFSAAILVTGSSLAPKENPGTVMCMDQIPQESAILNSETVDDATKRAFIRELPIHLQSQAHCLLLDAGWRIEPYKRQDRTKLAYNFIAPEGLPFRSLCQAWRGCGERLLCDASGSEQDENGREWIDINVFWNDLADTLSYIEKETNDAKNSVPLLHRWKIIDPFMAVVWIDKRISALRDGRPLRAVRSATFFLGDRKNTIPADECVDQVDDHLTKPDSCVRDSLSQSMLSASSKKKKKSMLSAVEPDCKSEVFEGACKQQVLSIQGVQELQKEHKYGPLDGNLCSSEEMHKRSLKSLARRTGKGLYNPRCLHRTHHRVSACDRKKANNSSSKSTFMERGSCSLYIQDSPLDHLSPQGSVTPDSQTLTFDGPRTVCSNIQESVIPGSNCDLLVRNESFKGLDISQQMRVCYLREKMLHEESNEHCKEGAHYRLARAIMSDATEGVNLQTELLQASATNAVNGSVKKVKNKSKNISEIEATEANSKGMEVNLHAGASRDLSYFSMSGGICDHYDLLFPQEEDNTFSLDSTPEHIVQTEHLKKQNNIDVKSSKTEQDHISAVAESSSTKKKPVKSATKAAKQNGKERKSNLNMPLEDEPGGTLLNVDRAQEDLTHHRSTTSVISQQKKRPKPKKVPRHHTDSKESVVGLNDGNIHIESHSEGSNDVLVPAIGASPDTWNAPKVTKASKKSKVCIENGWKKPRGCLIDDDDLLIAAILQKKGFSFGAKHFASKVGAPRSEALKRYRGKKGSCKLLLRTPGKGGKHSMDGRRFILGTKTVLCWLIETGAVSLKDVVQFRNPKNNEVVKDGWITRDGILCKCCSKILSVSDFKAHAGFKQHKPCLNLFLQCGKPYTLCQLQAWSTEYKARKGHMRVVEVDDLDQNDDTCGLCGDGGELICCDNCPSTYHQACLPSQELPESSWYCSSCICEICLDVVNPREASSSLAILECSQCEHKYHDTCIKERVTYTGEVGSGTWFCKESCQEVYSGLRSRVGLLNNIGDGFSFTILRCSHDVQKIHSAQRIAAMAECNTKLATALTIMEECFLPMVDPKTGIDMIPHVLYNWRSNFARLNYQGFYTVVMEKGDELVSVASIRLHGVSVAEMPLIATGIEHRRQGICRRLMNEVEKMLKSFKVKMLVLSAIPNLVDTWTTGFGFKPIEDDDKQQLKSVNLMLLPGSALLKKNLCEVIDQEPGPAFKKPLINTIGNGGFYSREYQSRTFGVSGEKSISECGQRSVENARTDLDAESLFPVNMNMPVEQNEGQQIDVVSSENPALTERHSKHGDINNAESINVQIRTSHIYDMDQLYTAVHSCSGSLSPARYNDLPCVPSSTRILANVGEEEENPSQNSSILIEDSAVDVANNERRASVEGDEIENGKDCCLSGKQIGEGPFLAAPCLNDKNNLGDFNLSRVLVDSSTIS